jgi:orotate phosphoribosyltransferase
LTTVAWHHELVSADLSELARPRRGHFDLGTGYHGDLWLELDGLFLWPARIRPAAGHLADYVRQYQPTAVCGPVAGGAFLAQMVAEILGAAFLPAYHEPGPPARYRLPRAALDEIAGWPVAVVDDAVNAGTAVQASCQELRAAGASPVAAAALLALGPSVTVVSGTLGLPFHALMTLPSQVWPASACPPCAAGTPLDHPPI